jgi:hypothetical protein
MRASRASRWFSNRSPSTVSCHRAVSSCLLRSSCCNSSAFRRSVWNAVSAADSSSRNDAQRAFRRVFSRSRWETWARRAGDSSEPGKLLSRAPALLLVLLWGPPLLLLWK